MSTGIPDPLVAGFLRLPRDGQRDAGAGVEELPENAAGRSSRVERSARTPSRPELAGAVRIRHAGRDYAAWYRVVDDLLTVYCGLASNTGLLPHSSPSPKPLAERLLRELIEAEHPGLNPE